jgi:DNA repair exonuclease SbcCD ATPase subunit
MNIRSIRLQGAYGHEDTTVDLPPAGVVVVTGSNGSGKSGLFLEAVAVALWGRTLRGAPAWGDSQQESSATVRLGGLEVSRLRAKGKTLLAWRPVIDGTEEGRAVDSCVRLGGLTVDATTGQPVFETTTKAQEALDAHITSFDVWRRTCALSSADAAHFSLATDAERKRLLESVLGIERFDVALQSCRDDLSVADARARTVEREIALAQRSREHERAELEKAERELATFNAQAPPPIPLPSGNANALLAMMDGARKHARSLRDEIAQTNERLRELARAGGAADAEAAAASRVHDQLVQHRDCPTCGQEIANARLEELRQKANAGRLRAAEERKKVHADVAAIQRQRDDELTPELREADDELRALQDKYGARDAAERASAARDVERDRWEAARARLAESEVDHRARVEDASSKLEDAEKRQAAVDRELDTLKAVETVLGMKGVRVQLLARALGGLEAVANAWLPRLGLPGLGLRLRPYVEKKTGGQSEAIGMEVAGAGGGHGYRAASAGERRRIDLAVLLALGEVAAAARGVGPSTLLFDELFDALDAEGVEAVTSALGELAQDRAVVVISHNPDLVRALPAARRYHVEDGRVT